MSMHHSHVLLLIHHASTSRPPCLYLKATMPCPCTLTSYSLIFITMCAPCVHHEEPLSLDIIPNPNSFQNLPDLSRLFQPLSHALHLLQTNNNTIYLCPANPNPSQSLSTLSSYNNKDKNNQEKDKTKTETKNRCSRVQKIKTEGAD